MIVLAVVVALIELAAARVAATGRRSADRSCMWYIAPQSRQVRRPDEPLARARRAAPRAAPRASSGLPRLREHRVERLGLRDRAREAVEDEAAPRSRAARGAPRPRRSRPSSGTSLPRPCSRLRLACRARVPARDRVAQHVAGRDLRDAEPLAEALRLRALARPGGPEQQRGAARVIARRLPRMRAAAS